MRIDDIEVDDTNMLHLTRHGVSLAEVIEAFDNTMEIRRNRSGRTADYCVIGRSDGGKVVRVNFIYDAARHTARPISA